MAEDNVDIQEYAEQDKILAPKQTYQERIDEVKNPSHDIRKSDCVQIFDCGDDSAGILWQIKEYENSANELHFRQIQIELEIQEIQKKIIDYKNKLKKYQKQNYSEIQ